MQWKWVQNYCFEQIARKIGGNVCIHMLGIIIIITFIPCFILGCLSFWNQTFKRHCFFVFSLPDLDNILFVIFIVFILITRKHWAIHGSVPQVKGMKNGMENQIMSYSQYSWENILCSPQNLWEFVSIFFSLPESIQLFSSFIFSI